MAKMDEDEIAVPRTQSEPRSERLAVVPLGVVIAIVLVLVIVLCVLLALVLIWLRRRRAVQCTNDQLKSRGLYREEDGADRPNRLWKAEPPQGQLMMMRDGSSSPVGRMSLPLLPPIASSRLSFSHLFGASGGGRKATGISGTFRRTNSNWIDEDAIHGPRVKRHDESGAETKSIRESWSMKAMAPTLPMLQREDIQAHCRSHREAEQFLAEPPGPAVTANYQQHHHGLPSPWPAPITGAASASAPAISNSRPAPLPKLPRQKSHHDDSGRRGSMGRSSTSRRRQPSTDSTLSQILAKTEMRLEQGAISGVAARNRVIAVKRWTITNKGVDDSDVESKESLITMQPDRSTVRQPVAATAATVAPSNSQGRNITASWLAYTPGKTQGHNATANGMDPEDAVTMAGCQQRGSLVRPRKESSRRKKRVESYAESDISMPLSTVYSEEDQSQATSPLPRGMAAERHRTFGMELFFPVPSASAATSTEVFVESSEPLLQDLQSDDEDQLNDNNNFIIVNNRHTYHHPRRHQRHHDGQHHHRQPDESTPMRRRRNSAVTEEDIQSVDAADKETFVEPVLQHWGSDEDEAAAAPASITAMAVVGPNMSAGPGLEEDEEDYISTLTASPSPSFSTVSSSRTIKAEESGDHDRYGRAMSMASSVYSQNTEVAVFTTRLGPSQTQSTTPRLILPAQSPPEMARTGRRASVVSKKMAAAAATTAYGNERHHDKDDDDDEEDEYGDMPGRFLLITGAISELRRMNSQASALSITSSSRLSPAPRGDTASPTLSVLRGGGFGPSSRAGGGLRNYLSLGETTESIARQHQREKQQQQQQQLSQSLLEPSPPVVPLHRRHPGSGGGNSVDTAELYDEDGFLIASQDHILDSGASITRSRGWTS